MRVWVRDRRTKRTNGGMINPWEEPVTATDSRACLFWQILKRAACIGIAPISECPRFVRRISRFPIDELLGLSASRPGLGMGRQSMTTRPPYLIADIVDGDTHISMYRASRSCRRASDAT